MGIPQPHILELKEVDAGQGHPGDQDHQAHREEGVANPDRPAVGSILGVLQVDQAEDQERQEKEKTEEQVEPNITW